MTVLQGDCLEILKALADESVDSLVTDPPAGISFMGKSWDCDKGGREHWIAWMAEVMRQCMRVMKPGAHGLVWAIPRTSHWTATALEDAGFEVRDCISHLFATGFPKSLNVVKALEKDLQCELKWQPASNAPASLSRTLSTPEMAGSDSVLDHAWLLIRSADHSIRVECVDGSSTWRGLMQPERAGETRALFATSSARLNGKNVWSGTLIQIGKAGDSSAQTDTWLYSAKVASIDSNTISLLKESLGVDCSQVKTFTTLTSVAQTTGLKIFNFFQNPNTLSSIASVNHTALKPAAEFWWLVRKPCSEKTVAANVLKHGIGALNIDASRIGNGGDRTSGGAQGSMSFPMEYGEKSRTRPERPTGGRFPANLVLSHSEHCTKDACCMFSCPVAELDRQSGILGNAHRPNRDLEKPVKAGNVTRNGMKKLSPTYEGVGGASRFFYCAKISSSERNAGLDEMPVKSWKDQGFRDNESTHLSPRAGAGRTRANQNHHPTVKPKKLMAYLIRLITPPGGTVLDPFAGSGSTGVAAKEEGFDFIGIEREAEYHAIATARIEAAGALL